MEKIRVLIADDSPRGRGLLDQFLDMEPDLQVVALTASGPETVRAVQESAPDVIVLDGTLGEDPRTLRQLAEVRPEARVLLLTTDEPDDLLVQAFARGAKGALPKREALHSLADAIRALARGEAWVEPRLIGRLLAELTAMAHRSPPGASTDQTLSRREREVLAHLGAGRTNAQIAQRLYLSPHTVKIHVSHILRKLGLPNRTEAALFALKHGVALEETNGAIRP